MYLVSFFQEQRGDRLGGWTFSLHNQQNDVTALIASINTMRARLEAFLGVGCGIVKARYSVLPGFRIADEVLFSPPSTSDPGAWSDKPSSADYQTSAVGLRLIGTGTYRVSQSVRGGRDRYISKAGRVDPALKIDPFFLELRAALSNTGQQWCLYVLDKFRPKVLIQAISSAGVVSSNSHGFATNDKVRVQRVKQGKYPNKIWDIIKLDDNSFQLSGFSDPVVGSFYYCRGAIARKQLYTAVGITDLKVVRATSHKTGRPTDLLSGKSKIRR